MRATIHISLCFLPSFLVRCVVVTLRSLTRVCRVRVCSDDSNDYKQFLGDMHVRILA